jgi:hypothetical protein
MSVIAWHRELRLCPVSLSLSMVCVFSIPSGFRASTGLAKLGTSRAITNSAARLSAVDYKGNERRVTSLCHFNIDLCHITSMCRCNVVFVSL